MGGVFSSVRDLARWVSGFLDAFPARDEPEGTHPLRRSSRREMQQAHRAIGPAIAARSPDAEPAVVGGGYGFGLFVQRDPELGTIIGHPGGYPGFGSHMAWHPATGIGVIGLGNHRYAPLRRVVAEALADLVRADTAPRRRVLAMPAVAAYRPMVDALVNDWDDAAADGAFAMNMDLDEPRERRRAAVTSLSAEMGPLRPDDTRPVTSDSPADLTWWLRGSCGWARISILVTPEPSPRIQALTVRSVGDPSPALRTLAQRILALAAEAAGEVGPAPFWPDDLPLGPGVDRPALERALRAAGPVLGTLRLGLPIDGDGRTASTFALESERGNAELRVGLDPDSGVVTVASLLVKTRAAAPEAW
jgi:hypothetical protein